MRRRNSRGIGDCAMDVRSSSSSEETPIFNNPSPAGTPKMEKRTCDDRSRCSSANAPYSYYRRFYILHSAIVLAVLIVGMMHNGGNRKYIPVNQKELFHLMKNNILSSSSSGGGDGGVIEEEEEDDEKIIVESCRKTKAYVNVHSSTMEDADAAIFCCPGLSPPNNNSFLEDGKEKTTQYYQSNLCHPRLPIMGISTQQLPLARRLTRLIEAWTLPLLPIFIRLFYQLVVFLYSIFTTRNCHRKQCQNNQDDDVVMQREATSISNSTRDSSSSLSSSKSSHVVMDQTDTVNPSSSTATTTAAAPLPIGPNIIHIQKLQIRITLQRLLFYFFLLNFRGWCLFIGANALEGYVIRQLPWIAGSSRGTADNNEPECWYEGALKAHHKSAMESSDSGYDNAHCYGRPFDFSDHVVLFLAHYLPIFVMEMLHYYSFPFWDRRPGIEKATMEERQSSYFSYMGTMWNVLHVFLFLYLHLLVLHALYLTAVYFHTPAEIMVGYGVSLILQLPVGYLMCTGVWHRVRKYIGLPSEGGLMSEKGD